MEVAGSDVSGSRLSADNGDHSELHEADDVEDALLLPTRRRTSAGYSAGQRSGNTMHAMDVGFSDHEDPRRHSRMSSRRCRPEGGCGKVAAVLAAILLLGLLSGIVDLLRKINRNTAEELGPEPPKSTTSFEKLFEQFLPTAFDTETPGPEGDVRDSEQLIFWVTPHNAQLLLLEIPIAVLDNPDHRFLFSAIFDYGSFFDESEAYSALLHMPAENTDDTMFTLQLAPDLQSVHVVRVPAFVRTGSDASNATVTASAVGNPAGVLPVRAIEYEPDDPNDTPRSVICDAEPLLLGGFFITAITEDILASASLDLARVSSYPSNANVVAQYTLSGTAEVPASTMGIFFSVTRLADEAEPSRAWDPRVGFFSTGYYAIGDARANGQGSGHQADNVDAARRFIHRRDLPARYYIDPSVPPQWRSALCEGVTAWNDAFEGLGLEERFPALSEHGVQAVHCIQPGDDGGAAGPAYAWPEDYEAGDARYSSISWAVDVEETYALGPSTVDPRSGVILNSDIVFTQGWVHAWTARVEAETNLYNSSSSDTRRLGEAPATRAQRRLKAKLEATQALPAGRQSRLWQAAQASLVAPDVLRQLPVFLESKAARRATVHHHGLHGRCADAMLEHRSGAMDIHFPGAVHSYSHAVDAAGPERRLAAPTLDVQVLEAGLKDVVMHEVGHTMGLRHNFKGSTESTKAQLRDPGHVKENGLTSSVMDYLPLNLWAEDFDAVGPPTHDLFTPGLGAYDKWAIKYGYVPVDQPEVPGVQSEDLQKLANQALAFGTDEDDSTALGIDITTNTFDLSSDPIDYFLDQLLVAEKMRRTAADRAVFEGEAWTRIHKALGSAQRILKSSGTYLTKAIGGYELAKALKTDALDPTTPITAVEVAAQNRSLDAVLAMLRGEGAGGGNAVFDPNVKTVAVMRDLKACPSLATGYCYGVRPVDPYAEADKRNRDIVGALLDPERLERVRAQAYTGDGLGLAPFFSRVGDALLGGGAVHAEVAHHVASQLMRLANRTDAVCSATVSEAAYTQLRSLACDTRTDLLCKRVSAWLAG